MGWIFFYFHKFIWMCRKADNDSVSIETCVLGVIQWYRIKWIKKTNNNKNVKRSSKKYDNKAKTQLPIENAHRPKQPGENEPKKNWTFT